MRFEPARRYGEDDGCKKIGGSSNTTLARTRRIAAPHFVRVARINPSGLFSASARGEKMVQTATFRSSEDSQLRLPLNDPLELLPHLLRDASLLLLRPLGHPNRLQSLIRKLKPLPPRLRVRREVQRHVCEGGGRVGEGEDTGSDRADEVGGPEERAGEDAHRGGGIGVDVAGEEVVAAEMGEGAGEVLFDAIESVSRDGREGLRQKSREKHTAIIPSASAPS